jgi:hypothetical protein
MQLSKHFSLAEFINSESAKRNGIDNKPKEEHIENLKSLCENVLEPIREHFKVPIHISSGYRSDALNRMIGGSKSSQHSLGQAADVDMEITSVSNKQIFDYISKNLDFDQLINEFDYSWVHVSYKKKGNRKQSLKAIKTNGKTVYVPLKDLK